jgi:hypothetical protein
MKQAMFQVTVLCYELSPICPAAGLRREMKDEISKEKLFKGLYNRIPQILRLDVAFRLRPYPFTTFREKGLNCFY